MSKKTKKLERKLQALLDHLNVQIVDRPCEGVGWRRTCFNGKFHDGGDCPECFGTGVIYSVNKSP